MHLSLIRSRIFETARNLRAIIRLIVNVKIALSTSNCEPPITSRQVDNYRNMIIQVVRMYEAP